MPRPWAWFESDTLAGLRVLAIVASLYLGACHAPDAPNVPVPVPPSAEKNLALPGGWTSLDPWADEAQEAARFAVQTYAVAQRSRVLYTDVIEAQRQVVAGVHFQLSLQVTHDSRKRTARVTVARQPNGSYELIDWRWLD
jgi:hypothetical protein